MSVRTCNFQFYTYQVPENKSDDNKTTENKVDKNKVRICEICYGELTLDVTQQEVFVGHNIGPTAKHLFHRLCFSSSCAANEQQNQPPFCPTCKDKVTNFAKFLLPKPKLPKPKLVDRDEKIKSAAATGNTLLVQSLLDKPISEEALGLSLRFAIEGGHKDTAYLLLSLHEESFGDIDFGCAVWSAASKNYMDILKILLEKKLILEKYRGNAIWAAAQEGHIEAIELLLKYGPISEQHKKLALKDADIKILPKLELLLDMKTDNKYNCSLI